MGGAGFLVKVRGVDGARSEVETFFFTPELFLSSSFWMWVSESSMSVVQLMSMSISSKDSSVSMAEESACSWECGGILRADKDKVEVEGNDDEVEVLPFLALDSISVPPESTSLPLARLL